MGNRSLSPHAPLSPPPPLHQNSVVILTGASSGLGKQLAIKLSKYPIRLIITGRNQQRLKQTKTICDSFATANVEVYVGDLDEEAACRGLVEGVLAKYHRLDMLVLNAGINAHFYFGELKDEQMKVFPRLMQTNFYANVYLTKHALKALRQSCGLIVVISSASGKFGLPQRSGYCASKFALNGFFESLRTEEEKVGICMVYPSSLDTPMRSNDIMGVKHASSQSHNKQQSTEKSAEAIIAAIQRGERDVYIPGKVWLGTVIQPLFPNFMRNRLKQAAKL